MNALACHLMSVALCGTLVPAAPAVDLTDAMAQRQSDRQSCLLQMGALARHDCLREAEAALQVVPHGRLAPAAGAPPLSFNTFPQAVPAPTAAVR